MQVITHAELRSLFESVTGGSSKEWEFFDPRYAASLGGLREHGSKRLPYPADSGQARYFVRSLMGLLESGPFVVFISNTEIFPSCSHMPLANALRVSWGERRLFSEAPAHLFLPDEVEEAVSLALLAVLFFWEAWLFSSDLGVIINLSHDERAEIWSADSDRVAAVIAELS